MGSTPSAAPRAEAQTRAAVGRSVGRYEGFTHLLTPGTRSKLAALSMRGDICNVQEAAVEAYGLTPMQQGMLFHSLEAPQSGVDIEQILCTLPEPIEARPLERAWQQAVERHAILRTRFVWEGLAQPQQEVQAAARLHLDQKDWRGLSAPERERRLQHYLDTERRRGFELTVAPLLRLALIRTQEREYLLVWTFHHLLLDGRAVVLVLNEVFANYEALRAGREQTWPPPRPYREFIQWLGERDRAGDESYWREHLRGLVSPTPLAMAGTTTRALEEGSLGGEEERALAESTTVTLQTLAHTHGFTLDTILQGAWALLLSRYSGEPEVVFGLVRAGRAGAVTGSESIVGLCINTVPRRVRVPPQAPLLAWLRELRGEGLRARAHEHTALAEIQRWSGVGHGQPLFETLVNFQNPSWDVALQAQGGNWAARRFGIRSQSNYPLIVDAYGGTRLRIKLLYHRDRLAAATVRRLLAQFQTLLEGMATQPTATLGNLPFLSEGEERLLLHDWNRTRVECPRAATVPALIAQQARRTPEALAVAKRKEQLTYQQLEDRAERVAQHLRGLGVGPEVLVGVCLPPSVGLVTAWLGVLKAGGAYVPLDPASPPERLALTIEDAQPPVVLTQESLRSRLTTARSGARLVTLEELLRTPAAAPATPAPWPEPRQLAYVIYTSGSTGRPKGVQIEHGSLLNLIQWHQKTYQVTPGDRASLLANPAFDAATWEVWPYLTAGASLHLPDDELRLSPPRLLRWWAAHQITLAFVPTPIAEALFDERWPEGTALRALLTGGDKLRRACPRHLPCPVVNHYGPTEVTVVTTCAPVPLAGEGTGSPPIGRPIANTQVYVLNRQQQPVPIGVPGELYIGGLGVARGYHRRPDLTDAAFLPNPFSPEPLARLYQTGDLVRYLPDGNLEFIGRLDQQVKVRGIRVELGEIESVLGQHPAVREAVVIPRERGSGEAALVAYVVSAQDRPPTRSYLRDYLKQRLPEYMVPAAFVLLERLPLTPNGKVDRAALPAPPPLEAAGPLAAPRTPTEALLAGIWCEVLGRERVGIDENFFEAGGHSLLVMRVVARVAKVFGLELPLRELFEAPTVAALAERLEALRHGTSTPLGPTRAIAAQREVPLSFAQERLWFFEQLEPGRPVNNIPIALRLQGRLDVRALEQALGEILRRHAALRTAFHKVNGRPVARVAPAAPFRLAVVELGDQAGAAATAQAERLMDHEARSPFDLERAPLLRATLLRLGPEDHRLLLTLHHIVSDGWSLGILYRELASLYEAFARGQLSPLPDPPLQYADFAHWQREWLQGDRLNRHLAYWKEHLAGPPPALALPTDRPRPALQTYRGATARFHWRTELALALKELAQREQTTLFMVLLAAFHTLLHRYTSQDDIVVGSPVAGRMQIETEGLLGLFVNTLALRVSLAGDPTFQQLLQRVREAALAAYAHQDLPFEKLVDALQPERDLSLSPLVQVMFILQNEPLGALKLPGLQVTSCPVASGTAKFDLTFSLEETATGLEAAVEYNTDIFDAPTIARMAGHFGTLLEAVAANPSDRLSGLPLLTPGERRQLFDEWNPAPLVPPRGQTVQGLVAAQVQRTPTAPAVVFEDQQLSYGELEQHANRVARALRARGVGPETVVAVCLERSLEMLVGLLGILKAGAAYVPLDPSHPDARLALILATARVRVVLTDTATQNRVAALAPEADVVSLDLQESGFLSADGSPLADPTVANLSEALAYVIFTSGSTGQPKGVQVTQGNLVGFFAAMDRLLGTEPGVWLAVTNITFDISALELFWPLTRGFKVVIQPDDRGLRPAPVRRAAPERPLDFGLFYFSSQPRDGADRKYRLLLEGARFADQHGFAAVWTPERHFHAFGGLYPNPALTSAAVAMVTERLQIRAGSVVLPLHHPLRVAEEWAVVDNLSHGRVAVSFASGWHDRDFVLAPTAFAGRKEAMFAGLATVRKLWRGEAVTWPSGTGQPVEARIFPRPVQPELPVWITSAGNAETFQRAGELGANLLTHLLGQDLNELAAKVRQYREAWRAHGHPGQGRVALMLHTFVGTQLEEVKATVRRPFCDYLKSSLDLLRHLSGREWAQVDVKNLTAEDLDALADHAFERYFEQSGLFGTPETCLTLVDRLKTLGIDELACLIDFGVEEETVLSGLSALNALRERANQPRRETARGASIPDQILRHGVTHLQCTPTRARLLLAAPGAAQALQSLRQMLIGGEPLSALLAEQLPLKGELYNMYGPTETTVWSSAHCVRSGENPVPIGRPLANTQLYVLDGQLQPVPVGVPGELFIGGTGVARGYLGQPGLTAERFLTHPLAPGAGARLYRTGDRARYRPDGTLEFLGRLDHQVKIRGHRIELGEIEAVLGRHPAVKQAVTRLWEDALREPRLVAYVVTADGSEPPVADLKRYLREHLPEPLVPAAFVGLAVLPLTSGGKVDRKALPPPPTARAAATAAFVAPRTEMERAVAAIWQELLGINEVGLEDNFFDLGGHSLLVVQAQAKLRERLHLDVPVVKLFQHPSVGSLARFLCQAVGEDDHRDLRARARRQREAFSLPPFQEVAA